MIRPSWIVALVVVASPLLGCAAEPSFGRACQRESDCGVDAPLCVDARCVPARDPGDAGASCANPVPQHTPDSDDPDLLLRIGSTFGYAGASDPPTVCQPDGANKRSVVFALELDEDAGVVIAVDADFPVDIEVRPLNDGCGDSVAAACGESTLVVPLLTKGTWAVVVHGHPPASDPGRFTLNVRRPECPTGYVEFDDASCVGFRLVPPAPFSLHQPSAALVGGRVIFVDDQEEGALRPALQVFDPLTEQWSMLGVPEDLTRAGVGTLLDGDGLIVSCGEGCNTRSAWQISFLPDLTLVRVWDTRFNAERPIRSPTVSPTHDGVLVVAPGAKPFLLAEEYRSCNSDPCPDGFACVPRDGGRDPAKVCICADRACDGLRVLGDHGTGLPELGAQAAAVFVPGTPQPGMTFVHDFAPTTPEAEPWAGFIAADHATVARVDVAQRQQATLAAASGVVVIAGGVVGSTPSPLVEFVDAATRALVGVELPLGVLRPAVATFADTAAVIGGCLDVDCTARSKRSYFAKRDAATRRPMVGPVLPVDEGDLVSARIDDEHTLVVDSVSRTTMILERVPRDATLPPDRSTACATTSAHRLDADRPEVVIEGSITSGLDHMRSDKCEPFGVFERPEAVFEFELDKPANVEVQLASLTNEVDLAFDVWAFNRGCGQARNDLSCGTANGDQPALLLNDLPAGQFFVVVEAGRRLDSPQQGIVNDFAPFRLTLKATTAPYVCSGDVDDPEDDQPLAARPMVQPDDDTLGTLAFVAGGALCAGDVDHVLYEHGGGKISASLGGVALDNLRLHAAVLDDAQSAATGRPVLARVDTLERSLDDEQPQGAYVVAVRRPATASTPAAFRWDLALTSECTLDGDDSFVAALDDRLRPVPPAPAALVHHEDRSLCFEDDIDVVPLPAWDGDRTLYVEVDVALGNDIPVAVRRVNDDGTLGDAVPVSIDASGSTTVFIARGGPAGRTALVIGPTAVQQPSVAVNVVVSPDDGDRCEDAIALSGSSGEARVSLFGCVDDVDVAEIGGCTGYSSTGPDRFYALSLAAGEGVVATATPVDGIVAAENGEVSLYAFVGCPAGANACIAGGDQGSYGAPETITVAPAGVARTVYLAVDGYETAPFEATLTWSKTR